jgi:type II secretory pathway pseudopilin PulG
MNTRSLATRRGITLMEVLISIGILAIGLSSVVALVPAGKSEAAKAVVLDRSANLAMNVLDDAITFGLSRPSSVATTASPTMVVFDPLTVSSGSFAWLLASSGTMKPKGVFATDADVGTGGNALIFGLLQGRDDLLYAAPANEDDPPQNAFVGGLRSFQGRTTALLAVAPVSGAFEAGSLAKLTAIVFHNRNLSDPTDAIVAGNYNAPGQPAGTILLGALPAGRTPKDVLRPGTVVYCPAGGPSQAWFQVAMASIDEASQLVYVTFVGEMEPPSPYVQIALDSIGFAERMVTLEGSGPYGR